MGNPRKGRLEKQVSGEPEVEEGCLFGSRGHCLAQLSPRGGKTESVLPSAVASRGEQGRLSVSAGPTAFSSTWGLT